MSILIEEHKLSPKNSYDLMSGKTFSQEINSKHDNLGIIAIRFQTFNRINNDTVVFRIKENTDQGWYYSANYNTDQFQDRELFPFGFPIINNSKDKIYKIEVESKFGSDSSHVRIDNLAPSIFSKHKYQLRRNGQDSIGAVLFLLLKFQNIVTNISILYPILLYFLPFSVQILYIIIFKRKAPHPANILFFPVMLLIFRYYLGLAEPPSWNLTIIILWNLSLILFFPYSKINLKISALLLACAFYFLVENNIPQVEKVMYWFITAIIMGIIYDVVLPQTADFIKLPKSKLKQNSL